MSGFFFCGSIDEPVANASGSCMKPNSSLDQSTISSPMRERCTWVSAAAKSASATKSRSDTASSEFSNRCANPRLCGDVVGIERQARSGQRAGTERRDVRAGRPRPANARRRGSAPTGARAGDAPAAPAGPAGGACSRGGTRRRRTRRPAASSTVCRSWMRRMMPFASRRTQSRRSSATWSLRLRPVWSLAPVGAGDLGDPALDRGVDVLVRGRELERALVQLGPDLIERVGDREALLLGEQPDRRQHVDVRPRAGEVVVGEPLVERQADAERHQRVGRTFAEAAVPERAGLVSTSRFARRRGRHRLEPVPSSGATEGSSVRCRRDHVSTDRPQRRTNPAASSWRNASSAS